MPYPGVPAEDTAKVDRCVADVMRKQGYDKDKAIGVCVAAIKGDAQLILRAATDEDLIGLPEAMIAQARLATNTILAFEGACLARAEVNANRDGITDEGVAQIAESIRLMPLTEEHKKEPRGIFTKGYTNDDSTKALVDGLIWAGHFPEFAEEVQNGQRKLSLDVEAKLAICGTCCAVFSNSLEYCEHIKLRDGSVRWLHELTSVAGGAVKYPAGTGTVFPGTEGFTVISHMEEEPPVEATAEWWRKFWDKESEIPTSKFADKKNRKYPFRRPDGSIDPKGWMAAWRYAHKYSASGVISVLKKNLPKGYKLQDGSVVKSTGGKTMDILCPECGHEHQIETDAEKLQAELDAKVRELQGAQAKLEEIEAQVSELESQLEAEAKAVDRFTELSLTEAGLEFAKDALPSLRTMDDGVFTTFKALASKLKVEGEEPQQEEDPPEPPQQIAASEGDPSPKRDTWTVMS